MNWEKKQKIQRKLAAWLTIAMYGGMLWFLYWDPVVSIALALFAVAVNTNAINMNMGEIKKELHKLRFPGLADE